MKSSSIFKEFAALLIIASFYGCGEDDEPPVDCATSNLQASVSNIADATCGLENGNFQLTVSGGSAPFEFSLSGSDFQSIQSGTTTIEGVPSGNHTLTLRDGNNCTSMASVNISNVNNLALDSKIEAAGCQGSEGSITITATSGKEPYSFSLDGGAVQSENIFSDLGTGDYTALVADDDGCETSVTVSVLSGVSYNDQIIPIIDANCAISNCHDGSNNAIPDWTDLTTVQANAANIRTRTMNKTMPPAGRPDLETADINAIACWVDDGALNN